MESTPEDLGSLPSMQCHGPPPTVEFMIKRTLSNTCLRPFPKAANPQKQFQKLKMAYQQMKKRTSPESLLVKRRNFQTQVARLRMELPKESQLKKVPRYPCNLLISPITFFSFKNNCTKKSTCKSGSEQWWRRGRAAWILSQRIKKRTDGKKKGEAPRQGKSGYFPIVHPQAWYLNSHFSSFVLHSFLLGQLG